MYTVAHELGLDDEVVRAWPIRKLQGWMNYLEVKGDLEREAIKRAQNK